MAAAPKSFLVSKTVWVQILGVLAMLLGYQLVEVPPAPVPVVAAAACACECPECPCKPAADAAVDPFMAEKDDVAPLPFPVPGPDVTPAPSPKPSGDPATVLLIIGLVQALFSLWARWKATGPIVFDFKL